MTNKLRKNSSLHINDARIAGLYDLEHTIGKGHFAVVKLARHVFTGEKVAVKVIDKTRLDPVSTSHMMQEVRCMKLVQHPNIVRLYEVIDTQTKLFLILELGDYDMYEWVMKRGYDKGGCKESDAQLYFSQIIKAINYCHKLHVVHRDLKPENVVFFEKLGMVKLTDFGFSNLFTPGQQLQTSCGSLAYSAPEILLGDAYDAPAVDVWSLGVILYMLVCGRLPFQESNESETLTRILDCKFSFPEHVTAECRKLISSMLVRDPEKRATLNEIVQNKWVCAGDRRHAEALPLIVKEHLPQCAHTTIIEQMVAGEIGMEDEILSAIERNEYNHLTATYYLLAERVLACYRQAQANRLMQLAAAAACSREMSIDENCPSCNDLGQTASSQTGSTTATSSSSTRSRSRSNSWRGPAPRRAYSILKEESEEELSTYLRSSSRQSSRFFNIPPALSTKGSRGTGTDASSRASLLAALSRANSNDSFAPGSSAILEDDIEESAEGSEMEEEIIVANQQQEKRKPSPSAGPDKPRAASMSMPSSAGFPLDMPPPSATSTPFLQRLLAPICENNRDQSPDTVTADGSQASTSSIFYFDSLEASKNAMATTTRSAPSRAFHSTTNNNNSQLPPLPASSDTQKLRMGSGGGRLSFSSAGRPLRNAASLELFPPPAPFGHFNGGAGGGGSSVPSWGRENSGSNGIHQCSATSPPTPNPASCSGAGWPLLERHTNYANLSTLPSTSNLVRQRKQSSSTSLSRRNSSPSVSMFHCGVSNSLHSSRDRISPQVIQDLLEFSRLSGRMRRTASPDSRLSSRSPSPSCLSSGRVSPAVSITGTGPGNAIARLKNANNGSYFLPTTGGGMRKLSSSPHLLGICEEIEEAEYANNNDGSSGDAQNNDGGSGIASIGGGHYAGTNKETGIRRSQLFNCNRNSSAGTVRSARSASTGLTTGGGSLGARISYGSDDSENIHNSATKKYSVPTMTTTPIAAATSTAREES